MKQQLPKQVYTSEYRAQAVEMITRDRLSVAEVARKLAMSQKTLANWVKRAEAGTLAVASGSARREASVEEAENSRLRREVAELRMERDILKKATAFFAKEHLPGGRS